MDFEANIGELPFSLEAEQAVLGALVLEPESISVAMGYIKPDSFYVAKHRDIFAIMVRLFTINTNADLITIIDEAVKDKVFESSAEGKAYLAGLANDIFTIKNLENYCKIVEEKYYIRQLITAAKEIIENASGAQGSAEQLLDFAEQKIYDIRQGKAVDGLTKIGEVLLETYDDLGRKSGPDREKYIGVKSGYSYLDDVIAGLNKSDLIILAARPAMGKSAFALNLAVNVARHNMNSEVVIFSLEMSKEQNVTRMLSSESLVESEYLMKGTIREEHWDKLADGADRLNRMNIYLDDTAGITVPQMKAKLRRMKNLGLVIIDYLQLMSSGRRHENRVVEISEITRQLKLMAKELNVPVITLSQLSRSVDSRTDKRPVLSDLRESGSIEQDADIVMFLYRDQYYNADTPDPTLTECIVAKNRHGVTKTINLRYNSPYLLFMGVDMSHQEENDKKKE